MKIRCDETLKKLLYFKKDAEDAVAVLPEFSGKRFVRPPGYLVHVDNNCFIAETAVAEIKAFFEEQGLGDNAVILKQGLVQYHTEDSASGEGVLNWWPMIYVDASTEYPKEVTERLTQKLNALLDGTHL